MRVVGLGKNNTISIYQPLVFTFVADKVIKQLNAILFLVFRLTYYYGI